MALRIVGFHSRTVAIWLSTGDLTFGGPIIDAVRCPS